MFVLKERKYTWLYMYKIPFSCDPVSTIAVTIQKAITALVNVFQVVVVAEFLDKMVQAVVNQSFNKEVIVWFVLMLLIVSWKRISYNIGRIFTKHFVIRGNKQVLCECTEKRDRLSYYLLEDPETEELTNRVLNNVENNLNEMLEIATILSEGFPQVRVDLYNVDNQIYFGEMTFSSNGGRMGYFSQRLLKELGDKISISC